MLLVHFPFVIKPTCYGIATAPECSPSPWYDPGPAARQETWKAMEVLQQTGRARAIGISDYNSTHLAETLQVATRPIALHQVSSCWLFPTTWTGFEPRRPTRAAGAPAPPNAKEALLMVLPARACTPAQVEWNPLQHDEAMLELCQKHGIQLQAWSPLGGASGSVFTDPTIQEVAAAHKVSAAQVALKWSLQRGVAVVTGTANPEHMASDLDVWDFTLSSAEMARINAIQSAPRRG